MGDAIRPPRRPGWARCGEPVDEDETCSLGRGHDGDHSPFGEVRPALLAALRHPKLAELAGRRIGPLFPGPEGGAALQGMRGVPRRATKRPFRYGRQRVRRAADAVQANCLSCRWKTAGRTWRPVRGRLADHVGKKHPKLAVAS